MLGRQQVEDLYVEAITILKERTDEILRSPQNDSQSAENNAHALAGLSSNYGLPAMAAICSDLEDRFARDDGGELGPQLSALESTCSETILAVRQALQSLG